MVKDYNCCSCGSLFQSQRTTAKYCSSKCSRQSNYHKTKKKVLSKEYQLQKRYGISIGQFESLVENQKGLCAICTENMVKPYVDHCHTEGHVRGLLCMKCNAALGLLKENVNSMCNMICYIKKDIAAQRERS